MKCEKCGIPDDSQAMCVHLAGKKGGQKASSLYGPEFYKNIGKRGGEVTRLKGKKYFKEIGRKGGAVTRAKGSEHFQEIGKKGGERIKELVELGKKAKLFK